MRAHFTAVPFRNSDVQVQAYRPSVKTGIDLICLCGTAIGLFRGYTFHN
jgi:hypothetical protein